MEECFKIDEISTPSLQGVKYLSGIDREQLIWACEFGTVGCGVTFLMDVVIKTTATIVAGL